MCAIFHRQESDFGKYTVPALQDYCRAILRPNYHQIMPCKSKQAIFDLGNIDSAKQYGKTLLFSTNALKNNPCGAAKKSIHSRKASV